jgi:hypothetical protein
MTGPAPTPSNRQSIEAVKIACLTEGIGLGRGVLEHLTGSGEVLTVHEYPTTGGLTLVLDGGVFVNAPFDEWFCADARAELQLEGNELVVAFDGRTFGVHRVLPLPGYIGQSAAGVAMSHADRVRVSPIVGCAYDCGFCDLGAMAYTMRPARRMLEAIGVAVADRALPVRHVLISGGSPRRSHYEQFIQTCEEVIAGTDLPVDVMFSPMVGDVPVVDRLVAAGAAGFAINLELYADQPGREVLGRKYRATRRQFEATVARAVELLGSAGRVRSLIIPGLEPPESTLAGVEYLASLGCDPVLSPFRPARDIRLASLPPPAAGDLSVLLEESRGVVARHGVALGPDCAPCQHNTLSFPWDLRTVEADGLVTLPA